jgi:hypothetical protein
LPEVRQHGDAPLAGLERSTGEEESAGYLAGYRLQKHTFISGLRRLPRSEHGSWLASGGRMNRIATWCAQSVKAIADVGEKSSGWARGGF